MRTLNDAVNAWLFSDWFVGVILAVIAIGAAAIVLWAWRTRNQEPVIPTVGDDEGQRLASRRDDLIAQGVDPADLLIPIRSKDSDR